MPRQLPLYHFQKTPPYGKLTPRKTYTLAVENIHPSIRIAHRMSGPGDIAERIIFDNELVLILDGSGELRSRGKRWKFQAHDLLFIPPFWPHQFLHTSAARGEHIAVHFDFAPRFPSFADDVRRRPPYEIQIAQGWRIPPKISLTPRDEIEQWFLDLLRAREGTSALKNLEAEALLLRILVALFETNGPPQTEPRVANGRHRNRARIERSIAFIQKNFATDLRAADLARPSGLSLSRFNRLFREWTAYSPADYLRRLRVDHAKKLLADVDLSVKEVAALTGFKDPYHFSKVFHEIDGLPPSLYREAVLAGQER